VGGAEGPWRADGSMAASRVRTVAAGRGLLERSGVGACVRGSISQAPSLATGSQAPLLAVRLPASTWGGSGGAWAGPPMTSSHTWTRALASGASSASGSSAGGDTNTGGSSGEGASGASASGAGASAAGGSDGASESAGQSESDRRHAESGEYDTQERYKRVGNPISWANPTGGGNAEDNTSKHWRWIYPAGVSFIVVLCLWSRRKNLRREKEESMIGAPDIRMPDTSSFKTPAYSPPPPPPSLTPEEEERLQNPGQQWSPTGGTDSFGFSPPPQSQPQSGW